MFPRPEPEVHNRCAEPGVVEPEDGLQLGKSGVLNPCFHR
jgi:hypothetical protein